MHVLMVVGFALVPPAQRQRTEVISIGLLELPRLEKHATKPKPPPPPPPKPKTQKITPPKLISKPELIKTPPPAPAGNTKEEVNEPEKPAAEPLQTASLTPDAGMVSGTRKKDNESAESKGTGFGNRFDKGDIPIAEGTGIEGSGLGLGVSGSGRGAKGSREGGLGQGDALSAFARPLGGYQVKPRYPDSARRAGAQGTTLLKLRVLENGRVGDVEVEKSAGHDELDKAAAEAVKKWLFEPARVGKEPVAVWVLLPVRFELQ
jgi:protein TonB